MDSIYDQFDIKFIDRDGLYTNFTINDNDIVKDNLDDVLKILCMYTVGLFETDSINRQITFKHNGEYKTETIDYLCRLYYEKITQELNNANNDEDYEYEYEYVDENNKLLMSIHQHDIHYNSRICANHGKSKYIGKYKIKHENIISNAEIEYDDLYADYDSDNNDDIDDINDKIPLYGRNYTVYANVLKINSSETKELPGNWGSRILDDIYNETTFEDRYIMLDLNKFNIDIKDISDKKTYFRCKFTNTNQIQHAASMFGKKCTVEYTFSSIEHVDYINEIDLELTYNNDKIHVKTTYFNVDCL